MNKSLNPKDLRELAQAQHTAFHDFYLNKLPEEIRNNLHSLVDTLIMNLTNAADKIAEQNAKLEEADHIFSLLNIQKTK